MNSFLLVITLGLMIHTMIHQNSAIPHEGEVYAEACKEEDGSLKAKAAARMGEDDCADPECGPSCKGKKCEADGEVICKEEGGEVVVVEKESDACGCKKKKNKCPDECADSGCHHKCHSKAEAEANVNINVNVNCESNANAGSGGGKPGGCCGSDGGKSCGKSEANCNCKTCGGGSTRSGSAGTCCGGKSGAEGCSGKCGDDACGCVVEGGGSGSTGGGSTGGGCVPGVCDHLNAMPFTAGDLEKIFGDWMLYFIHATNEDLGLGDCVSHCSLRYLQEGQCPCSIRVRVGGCEEGLIFESYGVEGDRAVLYVKETVSLDTSQNLHVYKSLAAEAMQTSVQDLTSFTDLENPTGILEFLKIRADFVMLGTDFLTFVIFKTCSEPGIVFIIVKEVEYLKERNDPMFHAINVILAENGINNRPMTLLSTPFPVPLP